MALLTHPQVLDYENAERRRHPAIYCEVPSSSQFGPVRVDQIYLKELLATSNQSRYVKFEQEFSRLRDELTALSFLEAGWDGYLAPAPGQVAIELAMTALETLRSMNVQPGAILPSADGGVGICFPEGQYYAHLEFDNGGEAWALMYGPDGSPESWQLETTNPESIREAWSRIGAYLQP